MPAKRSGLPEGQAQKVARMAASHSKDAKAPTPADPTISARAAGRIFMSGNKAQRSEPFRI